jgi:hypothetical protein
VIAHALTIVTNELERHLQTFGGGGPFVELGNVAEIAQGAGNGSAREKLLLSVVNTQEERTLCRVRICPVQPQSGTPYTKPSFLLAGYGKHHKTTGI